VNPESFIPQNGEIAGSAYQLKLAAARAGQQLGESLSQHRRAIGAVSFVAFCKIYLGSHFKLPPSRMHAEISAYLQTLKEARGQRLALAAPRGHAKSTLLSLAFVLWCALYGHEPMIVIASATGDQAKQILKNIKDELLQNPTLQQDFPEICGPLGTSKGAKPFRGDQVVLPNRVAIWARGQDQGVRGIRHRQFRPTLIVVDDLEEQRSTTTPEARAKLRAWFDRTLQQLGNPQTNIIVVGTILHHDSLLAGLTRAPGSSPASGWTRKIYQALESESANPQLWEKWRTIYQERENYKEQTGPAAAASFYEDNKEALLQGTKVLWPELDDYHKLMTTLETGGRFSFQAEKQNQPIDPAECVFRDEHFRYWDDEFASPALLMEHYRGRCTIVGACDPSLGHRANKGDFSAIVTLLKPHKSKLVYVLDASLERCSPDKTLDRIVQLAQVYRYNTFYVESNGFQERLVTDLRERSRRAGVSLNIRTKVNKSDKVARIQSLEPMVSQGNLIFSRRQSLLLDQFRQFPYGHDDGPDAIEMALAALLAPVPFVYVLRDDDDFMGGTNCTVRHFNY